MAKPRERGEILRDVLITASHPEWVQFAELARKRGTSRSRMIRAYIRWELRRAQAKENQARARVSV